MVDVADLRPHPTNVRTDLGDLTELAASITAVGLLQPLLVKPRPAGGWIVVDGNRRLGALQLTLVKRVLCVMREAGDSADDVAVMVAAALHKQLAPLDLAEAFKALRNRGMAVAQIARATGYATRTVASRLMLLDLPDEAQRMIVEKRLSLADAENLAETLAVKPHATTRARSAVKSAWLTKNHPLAVAARSACAGLAGHNGTRAMVGGVACGQCWEDAIRVDTLASAPVAA
jgi:ParB family chromosome partitioning protein